MDNLISRQAAIERATKDHDFYKGATTPADMARRDELLNVMCWLGELPPAQPNLQPSCNQLATDYISRQAAIDAINGVLVEDESCKVWFRLALQNLPSAQPEQQWISCSERLPEDNRQVLIYAMSVHYALAKYDEMREADGTYKKQWVTFDAWKPFYTIKEVIAWMPLPEPYEERR